MANFADPERNLDHAEQVLRLLQFRAQGKSTKQAAELMGINRQHAQFLIREAIADVNKAQADLIAQRRIEHDAKLEHMYSICAMKMQRMFDDPDLFDDRVLRAAVMVLDRQAKLWGLDKGSTAGGANRTEWLANASSADIVREAEEYGLKIPEEFKTKLGV